MAKTVLSIITILGLCIASLAQDSDYYKAIQKQSSAKVQSTQFKKMEENALKNFSLSESYELLATTFGNTSERVWAVIYGEIYCNLSSDSDRITRVGSLVYQWYEGSLSRQGNALSISLSGNAQSSRKQIPFESLFEQSFLFGALGVKGDFPPLSIRRLTEIRKNQLSIWTQKKMPETELCTGSKPFCQRVTSRHITTGCSEARVPKSSANGSKATRTSFRLGLIGRARTSSRYRPLTFSGSTYCGSRRSATPDDAAAASWSTNP